MDGCMHVQSFRAPLLCGMVLLEHRHAASAVQPCLHTAVRLCILVLLQRKVWYDVMWCDVMCCAVLCCTVLFCAVLCCVVLWCDVDVLCCAVLVLYSVVLCCDVFVCRFDIKWLLDCSFFSDEDLPEADGTAHRPRLSAHHLDGRCPGRTTWCSYSSIFSFSLFPFN